jgi:pSer/pThr/pTyr-binding forkhead associated (FHA) protein
MRRASGRDRERVAARLRSAYAHDEISTATLDVRLGLALSAPTRDALRRITADLAGGIRSHLTALWQSLTARPEDESAELLAISPLSVAILEESNVSDVLLGRARDCSVVVADDAASRHHARLILRDGCWYVEDLHSMNGTYLNGRRVVSAPVLLGDHVQIGRAVFRLE